MNGGPSFLTQMCVLCPCFRLAFWATNHVTMLNGESRMDWIGRAMYLGPDVMFCFSLIKKCHVHGRLTRCDAALESDADLMDVAEHYLVSIGACVREV